MTTWIQKQEPGYFTALAKIKTRGEKRRREVFVSVPTPPFQVTYLKSSCARLPQAPLAFVLCLFCLFLCFGFGFFLFRGVLCSLVVVGLVWFCLFITQFTLTEHSTLRVNAHMQVYMMDANSNSKVE